MTSTREDRADPAALARNARIRVEGTQHAAAWATLLAIRLAAEGVFNVAEGAGYADATRARQVLGWDADRRFTGPSGVR